MGRVGNPVFDDVMSTNNLSDYVVVSPKTSAREQLQRVIHNSLIVCHFYNDL